MHCTEKVPRLFFSHVRGRPWDEANLFLMSALNKTSVNINSSNDISFASKKCFQNVYYLFNWSKSGS